MPYLLSSDGGGSVEEHTAWYGDRLRFEVVQPGQTPVELMPNHCRPGVRMKALGRYCGWPQWQRAQCRAILAPRTIERETSDYYTPLWQPINAKAAEIPPKWDYQKGDTWTTVNVDGELTNNNPFDLALHYLQALEPQQAMNPGDSMNVDRVVLSVAPFPANTCFNPKFDAAANSTIGNAFMSVVNVMLSQSRFLGEPLGAITSGIVSIDWLLRPRISTPRMRLYNAGPSRRLADFSTVAFVRTIFNWDAATASGSCRNDSCCPRIIRISKKAWLPKQVRSEPCRIRHESADEGSSTSREE